MPPGSSISRSSCYHEPVGETEQNLGLMRVIDQQFLNTPFCGVRQMTWHLQKSEGPWPQGPRKPEDGYGVNQKSIRRLMRGRARDADLTWKPSTSKPGKGHKTHPYPASAGCEWIGPVRSGAPISLSQALSNRWRSPARLPMRRGFLYLVAIMDWFTQLWCCPGASPTSGHDPPLVRGPWRGEADFCFEALNEAIHRLGAPGIMHTDQGSQFTSFAWTDRLKRVGTRISMDGKGRCIDNPRAFTRTNGVHALDMSRLWRSLKYECVYLHTWQTGSQAKAAIGSWITFCNHRRPHTIRRENSPPDCFLILLKHGCHPPGMVYFNSIETDQQAQVVA